MLVFTSVVICSTQQRGPRRMTLTHDWPHLRPTVTKSQFVLLAQSQTSVAHIWSTAGVWSNSL